MTNVKHRVVLGDYVSHCITPPGNIEDRARVTAAVCGHSKHPRSGAQFAADLICKYGRGSGYHNLLYFPVGGGTALLSCDTCKHFIKENSNGLI